MMLSLLSLLLLCASSSAYTLDFFTDSACTRASVWGVKVGGFTGLPPSGNATLGLCYPLNGTDSAVGLSLQSCDDTGAAIVNFYMATSRWVPMSCSVPETLLGSATLLGIGQCVAIAYSPLMPVITPPPPLDARPRRGFTLCTTPQKWLYHVGTLSSSSGPGMIGPPTPTNWIPGNTIALPGTCLSYNDTYKFNIGPNSLSSTTTAKIWNGAQDCLNSAAAAPYSAQVTTVMTASSLPIVVNGFAPTGKPFLLSGGSGTAGNSGPGVYLSIFAPETAYITNAPWQFSLTSYSDQKCGTTPIFTIPMGFTKHCAATSASSPPGPSFWRSVNNTDGTVLIMKMSDMICAGPAIGSGLILDLSGQCTGVTSPVWGFGSMRATLITPIPSTTPSVTATATITNTGTPLQTPTPSTTPSVGVSTTSTSVVSVTSSPTTGSSPFETPTPSQTGVLQSPASTPLPTPSITAALSTPTQSPTPSCSPTATLSTGASPSMTTTPTLSIGASPSKTPAGAAAAGSGVAGSATLSPGGAAGVSIGVILLVATGAACGLITVRRVNSKFPGSNKPPAMMSSHPVFTPPVQVYTVAVPNPLSQSQHVPQLPPAPVHILPSVTIVNAVSYPPPPMPVNFTSPTLLPQGWTQFSDETDIWYTDANGDSHWELPGAIASV
jgi:hypothetical protein